MIQFKLRFVVKCKPKPYLNSSFKTPPSYLKMLHFSIIYTNK